MRRPRRRLRKRDNPASLDWYMKPRYERGEFVYDMTDVFHRVLVVLKDDGGWIRVMPVERREPAWSARRSDLQTVPPPPIKPSRR